MSFNTLFWNSFNLYRNEITGQDDIGGYERSAILYLSNIKCQIQKLSGEETVLFGKVNYPDVKKLYTYPDIEIKTTDLIEVNSKFYNVIMISDECSKNDHLKIYIKLTDAPFIFYPESSSSESTEVMSSSSSSSSSSESSSSESSIGDD